MADTGSPSTWTSKTREEIISDVYDSLYKDMTGKNDEYNEFMIKDKASFVTEMGESLSCDIGPIKIKRRKDD